MGSKKASGVNYNMSVAHWSNIKGANAHSLPTLSNPFSVNGHGTVFRSSVCFRKNSMEYSKSARHSTRTAAFLHVRTWSLSGAVSSRRSCILDKFIRSADSSSLIFGVNAKNELSFTFNDQERTLFFWLTYSYIKLRNLFYLQLNNTH